MAPARAFAAWDALVDACADPGPDELAIAEPPFIQATRAAAWPLSQVIAAAMDLAGITPEHWGGRDPGADVDRLLTGLERHRRGDAYTAYPHERMRYYDDNAWIGLDFVQWHAQHTRGADLAAARRLLAFTAGGEHSDGGVHWREGRGEPRNTCSTAPAMQLALRLHAVTAEPGLVAFARRADAFLTETLESPDGLMWDHVDADGNIERAVWSYNQGTVVNARVLLAEATGDDALLGRAAAVVEATLDHFGAGDGWWHQPAAFNAVCFRNLLSAAAMAPRLGRQRIRATLDAYLDRVWHDAREDETGLFVNGGIGRYDQGCIDQAGLTQLFALAGWPSERLHMVA